MECRNKSKERHGIRIVLIAGALVLLVLLITPGTAAPGTASVVAVQGAMTANLVAAGGVGGVIVPRQAGPRSPYVPPAWVHYSGPTRGPRTR